MLVLVCTAALVFVGCRRQGGSGGTAGKLPLRYYMPGGPSTDAAVVTAAINEALARDGVNIDFQPIYVDWGQWESKTNLMLSTGEEFEMFEIMCDYIPISAYTSRNQVADLTNLVNQAPNLKARFDKPLWDSATVDGKIYAIPAYWRDASGDSESWVVLRKDIFDKYGLPYPTTTDQMISVFQTLQQRWRAEDGKNRYVYEHELKRPPTAIHRTYDTWPFYVSGDGIFFVKQNGEAAMYFETPEFRKDAEFMNALYTRGLIHPDILNLPMDTWRATTYDDGDFLACFMTGPYWDSQLTVKGLLDAKIIKYDLAPNKPYITTMPLLNANAVPLSTKNPEAAIKFLDWMYSSQANQDLVLYGIQGTHWTPVGNDGIRRERKADGSWVYNFDEWMIEYVKYHRFDADYIVPDIDKADHMGNIHSDNTVVSPVVGFAFDPERVRVEYANVMAEYTASITPIKVGVLPYAANYQAALAKMKAAGSDAVIAEYSRQLAAFIASKR
jgi:putative aldouronate transport system substrate-binding protein